MTSLYASGVGLAGWRCLAPITSRFGRMVAWGPPSQAGVQRIMAQYSRAVETALVIGCNLSVPNIQIQSEIEFQTDELHPGGSVSARRLY